MNNVTPSLAKKVTSQPVAWAAGVLALCLIPSITPAFAQDSVAPDSVVAKIGAVEITQRELGFAENDLKQQFAKIPEEFRKAAVLNALIDIRLLARAAEDAGLADSDEFKQRINFLRSRALHNAYFQQKAVDTITEEDIKVRYEKEIAGAEPQEEIDARHILVKTEDEAKAIIAELDTGGDFAKLAQAKSTGPSGANGGTLGYFAKGQMVPEFEQAAFALEKGTYTKLPVKTQFGWHIILVQDKRDVAPPKLEESQDQIRQILLREKYIALLDNNREKFKVEIIDEALKAGIEKLNTSK